MTHPRVPPLPSRPAGIPGWVQAVTVLGAVLFAAGGIIALAHPALLVSPHAAIDAAARVYARYVASRDLALASALAALLVLGARHLLAAALVLASLVQLVDILVDAASARLVLVPGLLVLAALLLAAARRLRPGPLRSAAWWRSSP